jgi:hypothetical protein
MTAVLRHGTICAYCGEQRLTGVEKPEHPIPAAIGSSAKVWTVCDDCNRRASRDIDKPFLSNTLILELRSRFDIRDHRRANSRRVPSPLMRGETDEGIFMWVDHDDKVHMTPRTIRDADGTPVQIVGATEEEVRRLAEREIKRAERDGSTLEFGPSERRRYRPELKQTITDRPEVFSRMAGKIALGLASSVYPESWRLSEHAEQLRELMGGRIFLANPFETVDEKSIGLVLPEPQHGAFFVKVSGTRTLLMIVIFGHFVWALEVDSSGREAPHQAWKLDPRRPRSDGRTTYIEMINAARPVTEGEPWL